MHLPLPVGSFTLDGIVGDALLASESRARAAFERIGASGAWPEVIAKAHKWGIIPFMYSRTEALGEALPEAEAFPLRRAAIEAFGKTSFRVARGIDALRALERQGIRAAAFKGLASLALIYDSPRQRSVGDADLMIAETDLASSLSCLAAAGFKRRSEEPFEKYIHFVENAPGFAGYRAVTLYGPGDSEIDLHWDLGSSGMPVTDLLNRAVPALLGGVPLRVVHPVDAFLLSAHHSVRDNFAAESSMRDLSDLQRLCALICESGWAGELAERAHRASMTVPVLAVTNVLEGYDPGYAVCRVASRLRKSATAGENRAAARLTRAFHYQLENGSLNRDLLYLVHPRPFRQIVAGLRRDWRGYRRSQHGVEDQLGRSHSLGRRAMELVKSCGKPRELRVARDLARAKFGS